MSNQNISKYISLILRHKPEVINIVLDKNGWADTQQLINGISKKYKTFNMQALEEIVRTDNKQRYSFNEDKTKIRANQGHSIDVDVELEQAVPPRYLYHGTATKYYDSIYKQGLIPKNRQYVHLSKDYDTAINVGQRHGKPVVFQIDTQKMIKDGYIFYLSKNGVYLTKNVPIEYMNEYEYWRIN